MCVCVKYIIFAKLESYCKHGSIACINYSHSNMLWKSIGIILNEFCVFHWIMILPFYQSPLVGYLKFKSGFVVYYDRQVFSECPLWNVPVFMLLMVPGLFWKLFFRLREKGTILLKIINCKKKNLLLEWDIETCPTEWSGIQERDLRSRHRITSVENRVGFRHFLKITS